MSKKVLVIGGAGYIGGPVVDLLLKKEYEVTVYDNLLYERHYLKNVNFIYGDICDREKIKNIVSLYDTVVLMAAIVGDAACGVDTKLTKKVNETAVKNICNDLSPDIHIIYFSTCSVYGASLERNLDETSATNPLSLYAETKLKAEKHIKKHEKHTIFRLGTIFGCGSALSRYFRNDLVVNVMTANALERGSLVVNGGTQERPIIAVKDMAGYVEEAIGEEVYGTFVLSKENVNIKDLGERVAKIVKGTKIKYTEVNFEDARNYHVDNSKSLSAFKYRPTISPEEEIAHIMKLLETKRIKHARDISYHNFTYLQQHLL